MVMHRNERGECDLRTLVDRQRKRLVDVLVRLHDPTDQAPKLRHLRVRAHVQLDDEPRIPIQKSAREEFRQHDSVVTILMHYSSRVSPKLRYSIIEDYGGWGHRTRLRNRSCGSTCVHGVPLASVYKGWRRRRPAKAIGAARMWSPTRTPSPSRSPPRGEEGRRKWRRRRGGRPPFP